MLMGQTQARVPWGDKVWSKNFLPTKIGRQEIQQPSPPQAMRKFQWAQMSRVSKGIADNDDCGNTRHYQRPWVLHLYYVERRILKEEDGLQVLRQPYFQPKMDQRKGHFLNVVEYSHLTQEVLQCNLPFFSQEGQRPSFPTSFVHCFDIYSWTAATSLEIEDFSILFSKTLRGQQKSGSGWELKGSVSSELKKHSFC